MRYPFVFIITILIVAKSFAQSTGADTVGFNYPRIFHITGASNGMQQIDSLPLETISLDSTELFVYSVVSPYDYNNWKEEEWKAKFKARNFLIVISEFEGEQKQQFFLIFYNILNDEKASYRTAYDRTLEMMGNKYGQINLKHILILNNH